jgi:hypothetical protein
MSNHAVRDRIGRSEVLLGAKLGEILVLLREERELRMEAKRGLR